MVHIIAVHFKVDVIAAEIEISRILHSFGDDFAHIVKRVGVVDVTLDGRAHV